ncbi:X2-like carbohydrate binding domain-containing protein [Bacillus sp. FJAT-28004]|uniref:X2-like carbohydrate binding domain-containing protein n=1 Tax=Bacillus sp. FJAT-28004 TaxID=1679165 RepID=UPI0006B5607B|nr:X2-like carbohydrate binding domain-containing protein [Bacillus sp. FJAT-28004]
MKRKLALLIAIYMVFTSLSLSGAIKPVQAASQQSFYVSPLGDDNNSGTSDSPFRTIDKAREAVREINSTMTDDIYVYLQDGEYLLDETLTFDSLDSGNNGYKVIYTADAGATPVISGGVDISAGWELYDNEKNIYKKTGVDWNFRQLYVGEDRGIRARQPNLTNDVVKGPYYRAKNGEYPYAINEDARSWASELSGTSAEMVILQSWSQVRGRIDTINETTGQVDFKFPESGFSYNHHGQGNSPYFFENALSLLDAEGEWYLDTAEETVYYKPRISETINATRIIAPKLETVVNVEGSLGSKVHDIEFSGITFMHSNWLAPSSYGYVDVQAGFRFQSVTGGNNTEIRNTARYTASRAMLELKYTSHITISNNIFQYAGSWGIMGYEGTDHTSIDGNKFSDNAGGGVSMGIVGDLWDDNEGKDLYTLPDGQSQFDTITNNTIDHIGLDYGDMVGIGAMLPQNMTIANNEISNLPYSGISIGWNWSDADHGMTNNQVHNNYIHDSVRLIQDGGGIYTLGRMDGFSNIYHNYIKNMRQGEYAAWNHIMGVYLDGATSYRMVERNVIDNTEHAFATNNAHDNIFRYNYYNVDFGGITSNTAIGNISVSGTNWPQEAQDIIAAAGPWKAPLPAPQEPVNLALKKPVTAFSHSNDPALAVDGDTSTRWAQEEGRTDAQWLTVDLGDVYSIASTSTMFELNTGYKYKIEYSEDGENWELFTDKTAIATTEQTNQDENDVMARYMRITLSHGWGGSIYEFSVYPGDGGTPPESNSLIQRNEVTFDKNPSRQVDMQVKMVLNGGKLDGIKNGAAQLVPDQDYKLFWDQVLIYKSYLQSLPTGENNLTFDFAAGEDPVLKVKVIEDDGSVNVALNKPVTASSQSLEPANAVDGNTSTRWAQQEGIWNTEGWLMVDLQGVYAVKSVTTMFELSSGYKYKIEYSMDGQSWHTYTDRTASETTQQTYQDNNENAVSARYMRIKALYSLGPSIYEFSVFGTKITPDSTIDKTTAVFNKDPNNQSDITVGMDLQGNTLTGVKNRLLYLSPDIDYSVSENEVIIHRSYLATLGEGKSNLTFEFSSGDNKHLEVSVTDINGAEIDIALSKAVVASSQSKNPLYAVDGDRATRWAQQEGLTVPQWLKVDLGDEYDITGVKTRFELNSGYKYKIESSTDGSNWTTYADKTGTATTQQINEDRKETAIPARYIRLNITDSDGNGAGVYDFNVFTFKEAAASNSSISPASVIFDKNPSQQLDAVIDVALNGNTLIGVKNGEVQLTANVDYTLINDKVTILKSYLAALEVSTVNLTFTFSAGQDANLEVQVMNTSGGSNGGGNNGGNNNGNPSDGGTEDGHGTEAPKFTDVNGHWAQANIEAAVKQGIVKGYTDGTFKPNATVTRAEFVVMLMNGLKLADNKAELSFVDGEKIGAWSQEAIAQALQAGIVTGYNDGSFRPAASVTRAELAVMIARAGGAKLPDVETTGFADDSEIPAWAKSAVYVMKEAEILKGRSGNMFAPKAQATRAEAITIILNLLQAGK